MPRSFPFGEKNEEGVLDDRVLGDFSYRQRLGQFFTPPKVVAFVWRMLRTYWGDVFSEDVRVIDPACGEGIFLVYAAEKGLVRPDRLFGLDVDPKVDGLWRRLGIRAGFRLHIGDGLVDHPEVGVVQGTFDLVVGNPPYGGKGRMSMRTERGRRSEVLFAERFVSLARPGGLVAIVLPEGIFANARARRLRGWLLEQGRALAVLSLPRWVFASTGTYAKTSILLMRKRTSDETLEELAGQRTLLASADEAKDEEDLKQQLSTVLETVGCSEDGPVSSDMRIVRRANPLVGIAVQEVLVERMTPGYWDPKWKAHRRFTRYPIRLLGDYITHITYGPIVTGKRPVGSKDTGQGVVLIGQKQFTDVGLDLTGATRVEENSDWDDPRARAQRWDLLFPRSGVGSLGKGRMGVFSYDAERVRAVVGCFVDIVRVQGIRPAYLFIYLKSRFGQLQIARLLTGVGTININFDQIRSLEIHVLPDEQQATIDVQWRRMNDVYERALAMKYGSAGDGAGYEDHIGAARAMLKALICQVEELVEGTRMELELG